MYTPTPIENLNLEVGQRVRLAPGRREWTVRAQTTDVVVLTQADRNGVLSYTVIDYRAGVRGAANTLGNGWLVQTDEKCQELADLIQAGHFEVSHRNWVPVELVE
jgi:hypothetical protein